MGRKPVYLPIPEEAARVENVPTYRERGFANCRFPDLRVHVDPEFQTFTYGHVRRGFGDIKNIARLSEGDVLFFYATLQSGPIWAPYIIGYFLVLEVQDCRTLSLEEIRSFRQSGFENNAHLKRVDPHVDFLVKGAQGSRLLGKAFPLAEDASHLVLRKTLEDNVLTATQKRVDAGKPWYRWTMVSPNPSYILSQISEAGC